jgi:hypothetical protein
MTPTLRCHPSVSRPPAPPVRPTHLNQAISSVPATGAGEDCSVMLNRERPPHQALRTSGSLPVLRSRGEGPTAPTPST